MHTPKLQPRLNGGLLPTSLHPHMTPKVNQDKLGLFQLGWRRVVVPKVCAVVPWSASKHSQGILSSFAATSLSLSLAGKSPYIQLRSFLLPCPCPAAALPHHSSQVVPPLLEIHLDSRL